MNGKHFLKNKTKKLIIIIITLMTVVTLTAIYRHKHRNDGKYWINFRSGVIHNHRCMHSRKRYDEELAYAIPDRAKTFRNCRICGGINPKK